MSGFLTIFTGSPFWQDISTPESLDGRGDFCLCVWLIPEFIKVCVPLRDGYIDGWIFLKIGQKGLVESLPMRTFPRTKQRSSRPRSTGYHFRKTNSKSYVGRGDPSK